MLVEKSFDTKVPILFWMSLPSFSWNHPDADSSEEKSMKPRKNTPAKPFRNPFNEKEPEKHPETTPTNPSSKTVAIQ